MTPRLTLLHVWLDLAWCVLPPPKSEKDVIEAVKHFLWLLTDATLDEIQEEINDMDKKS